MLNSVFKDKRISLGLNLEQISEELRIRKRYLEAIENNEFDKIEFSGFYLKGYIKTYGKYLQISENEITNLLIQPQTPVVTYDAKPEIKDPSWNFVIISLISMILVIFFGKSVARKISDQFHPNLKQEEKQILSQSIMKEDPVKDILRKYAISEKAVIFIKKSTFLKIQDHKNQIIFSGPMEAGEVYFTTNNSDTTVFSSAIDDIDLFPEEALISQNSGIKNPILLKHRILEH